MQIWIESQHERISTQLDLPQRQVLQRLGVQVLTIYNRIYELEWEALLGWTDAGKPVTRSVTSVKADPASALNQLISRVKAQAK